MGQGNPSEGCFNAVKRDDGHEKQENHAAFFITFLNDFNF
jgi:hypothetical protein